MFKTSSNFIGSFKIGDNIHHNLRVLGLLYKYFDKANEYEQCLLCKPIIIFIISIEEAILHDFHKRIQIFTIEGITNLAEDVIGYIQGKQIDELEKYIVSAKKHDLFDMKDTKFYEYLEQLRKLRNRIHIQNTKNNFEPDEFQAFNLKRKTLAERVLEKTLKTMNVKYSRSVDVTKYINDFELPWVEHYKNYLIPIKF